MTKDLIHILVIEDKKNDFLRIQEILSKDKNSFQVEWRDHLQSGLDRLWEGDIDLVLMDLTLPDGHGLEALIKLQTQKLRIPIVVLTAIDDHLIARTAIRRGAQDYIVKEKMSSDLMFRVIRYAIERKQVENELEVSRASFHSIVEKSSEGIVIVDQENIVQFCNVAACLFLQKSLEEIVHKPFIFPLEPNRVTETTFLCPDGTIGIGEIHVGKTDWENKKAFLITIHDISERKKLDQLKDEFIGNVSHELRTPLTSVRESVSQIYEGVLGETNEKQKRFLSICLRNADRLKRILNDLLDMSKIEAGKFDLDLTKVALTDLLDNVIESFLPQIENKKLTLKKSFPNQNVKLYIDKDKIIQVFNNLISNAIKFTEKGQIELCIQSHKEEVQCSIIDTGKGISEDELPKVFNKFQQFGKMEDSENKGTGLGLAISNGIIELHGGKIWVESKLEQGSQFHFVIPKYSDEMVLLNKVQDLIQLHEGKGGDFTLIMIEFNDPQSIQKILGTEQFQDIYKKIQELIKTTYKTTKYIGFRKDNEIIALIGGHLHTHSNIENILRKGIKEYVFEIENPFEVDFSYGEASYPVDGSHPKELLTSVEKNLMREHEKRLAKTILIADDEPILTLNLKMVLEDLGYSNVIAVNSGNEIFEQIKKQTPDLLILDLKMPGMSGYEVIVKLKENVKTKELPIIILSAYEIEHNRLREHFRDKVILTISKPFNEDLIRKMLYYML